VSASSWAFAAKGRAVLLRGNLQHQGIGPDPRRAQRFGTGGLTGRPRPGRCATPQAGPAIIAAPASRPSLDGTYSSKRIEEGTHPVRSSVGGHSGNAPAELFGRGRGGTAGLIGEKGRRTISTPRRRDLQPTTGRRPTRTSAGEA